MKIPADLAHTLAVAVDAGTLEAAAQDLHITQSAVSQRLQTLERLVGQVLLVRSRPVRATAAGRVVIRYARQVAHLDDDVSRELSMASAQRPVLSIGVNADSLATWFLPPLARIATDHDVTLRLLRDDEGRTADLLVDGTVVAAVTTRSHPVPGCAVTPLGTMTYRACASRAFADTWFAAGLTAEALAHAPVIDLDDADTLQTRFLRDVGADPSLPPRHRIPASADFARAIGMGLGWGVLPHAQRDEVARTADIVDLGGPEVRVPLYWQQWRLHSQLLDRVAAAVVAAAAAHLR